VSSHRDGNRSKGRDGRSFRSIAALKALAGPFPQVRFCPTGGINEANAAEWLALPNVTVVGGSWLTPEVDLRASAWDKITERARRASALRK
jgi:2-dehydro-3-deoxyphosphogluconate aldolase/(4S)-4-hydroxy-2-oxoglutarate aldolase